MKESNLYLTVVELFNKYKNFIIYSVIGVSGVMLDFIVFYVLFNVVKLDEIVANIISVSCGITNNFLLNLFFNFKTKDRVWIRFASFFAVGLLGMLVSSLILEIFHDKLNFNANIVKLVSLPIIVVLQYFLNKKVSFRNFTKSIK